MGKILLDRLVAAVGAVALTLAFFLILPVMQTIKESMEQDLVQREVGGAAPPPTKIEEPEPEEQEPEPEEQPELKETQQLASLSDLEQVMDPAAGFGDSGGGLKIDINTQDFAAKATTDLFQGSQLDQLPRPQYQPLPPLNSKMRRALPGKVIVLLVVGKNGRVVDARVSESSHPVFEAPTLAYVKRWQFQPGKRGGKDVVSRVRVPITYPK
jgi:TonB family protein